MPIDEEVALLEANASSHKVWIAGFFAMQLVLSCKQLKGQSISKIKQIFICKQIYWFGYPLERSYSD